ncbi:MAG TPA: polyprenyl synthetase family protein [Candidatus Baltobacteraceae bacterium]|jgi:geranylgeranyl diphosphate synthase type I|nr:polyprenyl synthetase family protein [Candidatus Baltobacteraceae bacterium]
MTPSHDLIEAIEARLSTSLRETNHSAILDEIIAYHFGFDARGLVRRGKRLRPQLLLTVAREEAAPIEVALDAAAAIELLHNYSLIHDDIEDRDELRHGSAAVWVRFGIAQGVNAGDALCGLSYLTLLRNEAGLPAERVVRMVRVLHGANLAMCEGQALDIRFEEKENVTMDSYLAMIAGKTGALFSAACELGALAAGNDDERATAYAKFGAAYGRAFQIRDDELGAWGSPGVTGKPSGSDIARRKWSFPVVWAFESASPSERAIITNAYAGGGDLSAEEVPLVIAALERCGARAAVDAAHDRALDEMECIAEEHDLDRGGRVREFIMRGARRVA